MDFKEIFYEQEESIAIITLNRPEKKNAMNRQLIYELCEAIDHAEGNDTVKAVVLTGGTEAFCAGADLAEASAGEGGLGMPEKSLGANPCAKIENMKKPIVAAIAGPCIAGGLELAMACDIRIAAIESKIGDGHIKMGLLGPAGGTARLPRLIGVGLAKELIFTGDLIDGNEACRIGLVNHAYPKEKLLTEAKALANRIAANGSNSLKISKRAVDIGLQMSECHALRYSSNCLAELLSSAEFKERVGSFLSKKKS